MCFKVASLFLIFSLTHSCFSISIKEVSRQEDLAVNFLFWSNSETEGRWTFDWSTWQWHYVTSRPEDPFSVHVDDTLDDTFSTLLSTENNDKFRPGGKTKIIIHGFTENGRIDWIRDMAHAYFDADSSVNVISVEWSNLAAGPDYPPAARNTQPVGQHVAEFINYIKGRVEAFNLSNVHIVGFSLGAQVAGKAGAVLNGNLARITGLDPAENDFMGKPTSEQLDSSDAIFVDVIHTSANSQEAGVLGPIGNREEEGDMDFWPNSGNCPMPGTEWMVYRCMHSHLRAYATGSCNGAEQFMGESVDSSGQNGNYYLDTNAYSPYAKGQTC